MRARILAGFSACIFAGAGKVTAESQFQVWPKALTPPFEVRCTIRSGGNAKSTSVLALDYIDSGSHLAIVINSETVSVVRMLKRGRDVLFTRRNWLRGKKGNRDWQCEVRVRRTAGAIVLGASRATKMKAALRRDTVCVARVPIPAPKQSKIAVSNQDDALKLQVRWIQPIGEIAFNDDFMRTESQQSQWETAMGDWRVLSVGLPRFSANAFSYQGGGPHALTLTGYNFWSEYLASAACKIRKGASSAGLVFAAQDQWNFYRFEWSADNPVGKFRLVRRRGGREEVLAEQPGALQSEQWHEFEVLMLGTRIEAGVDRRSILKVDAPQLYGGKIGLWCQGRTKRNSQPSAWFDDVRVTGIAETRHGLPFAELIPRPAPVVPETFSQDKYMKIWAHPEGQASFGVMLDYTFHRAPVDWRIYSGKWRMMPRWTCQPRWNWFGGRGPMAVTVWHKDRFLGNTVAEIFAAQPMDSPFDPLYRHPGTVSLTICGDGTNLDSGYSFVFAGWGNRWTRLLRLGKVVAETRDVLLPDNRDDFQYRNMHINWRGFRIQKTGGQLACFFDDKEILKWKDPQPLTGERVAVWTFDNSLLVARARITADRIEPGLLPKTNVKEPAVERKQSSSPKLSRTKWSFEKGLKGWANRDGQDGATLSLDATSRASGKFSLRLSNFKAGGSFSASVPITGIEVNRSALKFDYRIRPRIKINLYLKVFDWWYCVALTAPEVKTWRAPVVGKFEDVRTDDQWHSTSFDLAAALTPDKLVLPVGKKAPERLVVEDAFLGLWSDDHYSLWGFGCNAGGTSYHIDNFTVQKVQSHPVIKTRILPASHPNGAILLNEWETYGGHDGLRVLTTPWSKPDRSRSILVVNERLGGIAGAAIRSLPFDVAQYPIVSFDCKTDDIPRLDFQVELASGRTLADRWKTVKFTDYDNAWDIIGRVGIDGQAVVPKTDGQEDNAKGAKTDGQWHHYEFNLGDMLRSEGLDTTVTRLIIASGGYPGNEEGVHMWFANFMLLPAAGKTETPKDTRPPVVSEISPSNESEFGKCQVSVRLVDDETGILPSSIRLSVAGRPYSLSDSVLKFNRQSGQLTWDGLAFRPRPILFKDREKVECRLEVKDRAGNLATPITWQWRMRTKLDKLPPPAPYPVQVPHRKSARQAASPWFLFHDFEKETLKWGDWDGCDVRTTQATSALGDAALMLTSFLSTRFYMALCDVQPIPVHEYSIVSFDYRIDPVHDTGLLLYGVYMLIFDGERDVRTLIRTLPTRNARDWQHIEVDLRPHIKLGMGAPYGLLIGEQSRQVKRAGDRIFVDNFAVRAEIEGTASFKWNPPLDSSGITGYSLCVDTKPDTEPKEKVNARSATARWKLNDSACEGQSPRYLHVRARDGAGNWGPAGHLRISDRSGAAAQTR